MNICVAICAHNSSRHNLESTLESLKNQTLSKEKWQLLLIDNASTPELSTWIDLSWHPHGSILIEPKLGLTQARLRSFKETNTDLLIMVDDDNVLDPDFLETTLKISKDYPTLGAWGASIQGKFEKPIPKWLQGELIYLAVRPIEENQFSDQESVGFPTPAGAGMSLRRQVIKHYQNLLEQGGLRIELDRKGTSLVSSGDTDIARCSWELGMGMANFASLKLTHLIPAERMSVKYMTRLHESMAYSDAMLTYIRRGFDHIPTPSRTRIIKTYLRDSLRFRFAQLSFFRAHLKGRRKAKEEIRQLNS